MKAIIISGSRSPRGRTAQAVEALLEGLNSGGGKAELIFLPGKDISRCRQCEDTGWGICRSQGRCTIEDDFAGIVDKIYNSDAVVFATPVYFGDLSESLRAFLDRLRRICRHASVQEQIAKKPAIGVCVAGGGGGAAPECAVSLEKVLDHCGFDLLDIIPVRRQNLNMKLSVLKVTGKWLGREISQQQ